jgi:cytochrome c-type biogenesis protein
METTVLYQVSLAAAFVAGMVALFAPCCISFLLPAYFANVFRERRRVMLMTLIYSLGIFVVMLPVVLGAQALSRLLFELHDYSYIGGGILMLGVALMALLGVKLPLPRFGWLKQGAATDMGSTFTLGIISGMTSACCAPVLVGVMALSSLTGSLLQALGVGAAYVLGMVAPLYLASALIEKGNILNKPWVYKKLATVTLGNKSYPILLMNALAAGAFAIVGGLAIVLTLAGVIAMPAGDSSVMEGIKLVALKVTAATDDWRALNILFTLAAGFLLYLFLRSGLRKEKPNKDEEAACCRDKKHF